MQRFREQVSRVNTLEIQQIVHRHDYIAGFPSESNPIKSINEKEDIDLQMALTTLAQAIARGGSSASSSSRLSLYHHGKVESDTVLVVLTTLAQAIARGGSASSSLRLS